MSTGPRKHDIPGRIGRLPLGFLFPLVALGLGAGAVPPADAAADALEWETISEGRQAALAVPAGGGEKAGFTLLAPEVTGVKFTNWLAQERHLTNQILMNGSGVAAADVDGDGWCDLYFCGLDGPNMLFRNLGGWHFRDVTSEAGVACAGLDAAAAVFADLDGDGDADLVVSSVAGGTHLFFNDGRGHFTPGAVFNQRRCGTSLALADIDGDGDLDLYQANYRAVTIRDQPNTRFSIRPVNGQPKVVSVDDRPISDPELVDRFNFRISAAGEGRGSFAYEENGETDLFLRNDGRGNFSPISFTDGTFLDESGQPLRAAPVDWGLSVMFRDLNGDGAPDLYVCNDFRSPDRIWLNDGHGHFRAAAPLALRQISLSSMGVDFADLNRDGLDDFLVVDMLSRERLHRFTQRIDIRPEPQPIGAIENRPQTSRNTLFVNRGDGTWAECAQFSAVDATEWSWSPIFLDVDLDGYEDLLVSNGYERDGMNMDALRHIEELKKERKLSTFEQLNLRRDFPRLETANLAFRNLGQLQFRDMSAVWGFNQRGVSQGMCLADLDNDGDLDVVINNSNAAASLYRNETSAPRLAVRLKGAAANTSGIGARITVTGGPVPSQSQEMISGGRYLSCDAPMRVFAAQAGPASGGLSIQVRWRSGKETRLRSAKPNYVYELSEAGATSAPAHVSPTNLAGSAWFTDVSTRLGHRHHEEPFDDFQRQPTLSRRLSQLGPGASWYDVDGDGWEDLILPSGKGGHLAVYRNDGRGGFAPLSSPALGQPVGRDQTTVLGWRDSKGTTVLIAGAANYEDGLTNGGVARLVHLASGKLHDSFGGQESSTGPLAMADIDGDGQLELFVGGRVVPGQYPSPASSLLFRPCDGEFKLDDTNSAVLAKLGLVSAAVFSDLEGDGNSDLVLACEWGPIRIFRHAGGRLQPWDPAVHLEGSKRVSLHELTGWWNGVTTADFDGDGRLDIAASNWGRNTPYEAFRSGASAQPLRLFWGELFQPGVQAIEGCTEPGTGRLVPLQPFHVMGVALPQLRERVATFEAYARATLPEIYGAAWKNLKELQASRLESTVFLNRGDYFEVVTLPMEAQWAPAFGVTATDLDGDGLEDLWLSQNFFAPSVEHSRYDAGRGLWLRGDGHGGFQAVPGQESGLKIWGEQRGSAAADYDGDGRMDLVVTQNGAETKLFRNTRAKPGLRIRLDGPPGNPSGIGACVRLLHGERAGPVRELHAGSGYWSQDSAVQVLGDAETATGVWVRWPGNKTMTVTLPKEAKEVRVDYNGQLKVVR
jgi:hypothetical protein